MKVLGNLALLAGTLGVSIASVAAGSDTAMPMTGQLLVKRAQAGVVTRVEYCLRNLPELTEPLVAAHAIYFRASTEAASILERQFPASRFNIQRALVETSPQVAAEYDLKQARSEGFNRVCPDLIAYMRKANGESLARSYGDTLSSLQRSLM